MRTLAVMQPYIFPYIGYFQMVAAVDKFIFYDDVNYIKQGWINRNKILVANGELVFTVPLKKASSFTLIKDTEINLDQYRIWKPKFLQTLAQSYKKAPFYNKAYPLVEEILDSESRTISSLAIQSVQKVAAYLQLETEFAVSSEVFDNRELERQERLLDICKTENALHYINAVGGQELYEKEDFQREGIQLNFIKTLPVQYSQFKNEFVPWLSIIDVMMFNSKEDIRLLLNKYEML